MRVSLALSWMVAAALSMPIASAVPASFDILRSQCGACASFTDQMQAAAPRGEVLLEPEQYPECEDVVSDAHRGSCETAVGHHGWDGVAAIAGSMPDLLCSALPQCPGAEEGDVLVSGGDAEGDGDANANGVEGSLFANLADAAVTGSEDIADDDDGDDDDDGEGGAPAKAKTAATQAPAKHTKKTTTTKKTSVKKIVMQQKVVNSKPPPSALSTVAKQIMEMMMQKSLIASQQAQQTQMHLQMIRMKILSVMDSNRQIKQRMRTMRRHTPGNCDCCQACKPQKPVAAAH